MEHLSPEERKLVEEYKAKAERSMIEVLNALRTTRFGIDDAIDIEAMLVQDVKDHAQLAVIPVLAEIWSKY